MWFLKYNPNDVVLSKKTLKGQEHANKSKKNQSTRKNHKKVIKKKSKSVFTQLLGSL